jgi:hypothetical protein
MASHREDASAPPPGEDSVSAPPAPPGSMASNAFSLPAPLCAGTGEVSAPKRGLTPQQATVALSAAHVNALLTAPGLPSDLQAVLRVSARQAGLLPTPQALVSPKLGYRLPEPLCVRSRPGSGVVVRSATELPMDEPMVEPGGLGTAPIGVPEPQASEDDEPVTEQDLISEPPDEEAPAPEPPLAEGTGGQRAPLKVNLPWGPLTRRLLPADDEMLTQIWPLSPSEMRAIRARYPWPPWFKDTPQIPVFPTWDMAPEKSRPARKAEDQRLVAITANFMHLLPPLCGAANALDEGDFQTLAGALKDLGALILAELQRLTALRLALVVQKGPNEKSLSKRPFLNIFGTAQGVSLQQEVKAVRTVTKTLAPVAPRSFQPSRGKPRTARSPSAGESEPKARRTSRGSYRGGHTGRPKGRGGASRPEPKD